MPTRSTRPVETLSRTIVVSNDVLDALEPHATRRGITVNVLCRALLGAIADDGLVSAVLEDAEQQADPVPTHPNPMRETA